MRESDFLTRQNSKVWKKIRTRYCILKLLVSSAKSEQELLAMISLLHEFRPVKNSPWDDGELSDILKTSIKELIAENKIKQRDILNLQTMERRIEWFLNPQWLSQTRLLKLEIKRVRELKEKELKAKAEIDRAKMEKEEKEKQIKLNQVPSSKPTPKPIITKPENSNSIFYGILSLVAVLGGIYVIGKIGESLVKAFTYPVFLITCLVAFSIYRLSKKKEK